jgi:hypothetical protein
MNDSPAASIVFRRAGMGEKPTARCGDIGWHQHRHRAWPLTLGRTREKWGLTSNWPAGDLDLATSGDFFLATDKMVTKQSVNKQVGAAALPQQQPVGHRIEE